MKKEDLMSKPSLSLYIHIPFCHSKCSYCDFTSVPVGSPDKRSLESERLIDAYFTALHQELDTYAQDISKYSLHSLFFGGGTPSAVDASYITSLLEHIKRIAPFEEGAEVTLEANPGTLTDSKIKQYHEAGINRVSMGFQTSSNQLLSEIGRIHTLSDFEIAYARLIKGGIDNISMDLMFGLPHQTMADIEHTLAVVKAVNPRHISAYALKLEEGTPMYSAYESGAVVLPEETVEREMYHYIITRLKAMGLEQYEISNFAHPGFESQHNLVYWLNQPYLGLGVSAHSKMDSVRFANTDSIKTYIQKHQEGLDSVVDRETIYKAEDLFESIILGLRLNRGLNLQKINQQYQIDFKAKYKEKLIELERLGLIDMHEPNTLKLTTKGFDLSNQVFLSFYPEEESHTHHEE